MYIKSIKVKNFRLLNDAILNLTNGDDEFKECDENLSLLIGRNNTGKTSFIVLLERFLESKNPKFQFEDYPISLRHKLLSISSETKEQELAISLVLDIRYDETDDLSNISDFILDLDGNKKSVIIYFEAKILLNILLKELQKVTSRRDEFIKKYLYKFVRTKVYALESMSDLNEYNRKYLDKQVRDWGLVKNLINVQVIHAKRDVASSESSSKKAVLSKLTSDYFNKKNKLSFDEINSINESMVTMDSSLNVLYAKQFKGFLRTAKDFLRLEDLGVISDLESEGVIENFSKVVYGNVKEQLPEHLNGLGYMNILYLILQIEIKRLDFDADPKDINILVIEEPEAHTHPQMQYVFVDKIKTLIGAIPNLQTIITSHSPHIVSQSDFKTIRYFLKNNGLVEIKDFYRELNNKYSHEDAKKNNDEKANFKFLQQYLTVHSSELFFAEKIVFIEGVTEKLLLPLFIKKLDQEKRSDEEYESISSQNISILEVGANSKAFRHFIDFLKIKTLIITDIDTTFKKIGEKGVSSTTYAAAEVSKGTHTSNVSIKYFLDAPKIEKEYEYSEWIKKLKSDQLNDRASLIRVAYQVEEAGYHARSFEDAFLAINYDVVQKQKYKLDGLKNIKKLEGLNTDFYKLTESVLDKKSEFASSLLWLALTNDIEWKAPSYVREGLLWIAR
jgi:putative ATP-dependent endonuclease of OLD family